MDDRLALTDDERQQIAKSRAYWNSLGRRFRTAIEDRLGRNGISELERRLKARGVSGGSRSMLNRYLNNDVSPSADFVVEVARELSISPGWLLTGEGSMSERRRDDEDAALDEVIEHSVGTYMVREFWGHDFSGMLDVAGFRLLRTLIADIHAARNTWEVVGPRRVAEEVLEAAFAPMLRGHARRHLTLNPDDTGAFNEYLAAISAAMLSLMDRSHLIDYDYEIADRTLAHEQAVKAAISGDLERSRTEGDPYENAVRHMTFTTPAGLVAATIGPGGRAECECAEFEARAPQYCEHLQAARALLTRDEDLSHSRLVFGNDRFTSTPLPPLTPAEVEDMKKRRGYYQVVTVPDGTLVLGQQHRHSAVVGCKPDGGLFRQECSCGFSDCGLIQALAIELPGTVGRGTTSRAETA